MCACHKNYSVGWVSVKRGLGAGVGVGVGVGVSFFLIMFFFFQFSFLLSLFLKPNSDFSQFASAVYRYHLPFTISAVYNHEKVANIY